MSGSNRLRLGILFWFYDHLEVCENRLQLLRELNPGVPIFGLFGGSEAAVPQFNSRLGNLLDDFYVFAQDRSPSWKWENGDLMIADWFRGAGSSLEWDTIVVVQWDMLVLQPVKTLFQALNADEYYISSVRRVSEIESKWMWTSEKNLELRARYLEFCRRATVEASMPITPLASIFLVVCLPKRFLHRFAEVPNPEPGFIEYRVPTYAHLYGFVKNETLKFDAWLPEDSSTFTGTQAYLIPTGMLIPLPEIYFSQILGARPAILHPYYRVYRRGFLGFIRSLPFVLQDLRGFLRFRKWAFQRRFHIV